MNLEKEEIVSICDSEVDACPQFLEQALNLNKETPKTLWRPDATEKEDLKKIDAWISKLLFAQLSRFGALPKKGVPGENTMPGGKRA